MLRPTHILSDAPAIEILDGVRHRKVSPRSRHARVQGLMFSLLERCGGAHGLAGTEWDFRPGIDSLLVPDVAFVSFERLAALPSAERDRPPFAPDIAVEVRSPSNDVAYRQRKIAKYFEHGCGLVLDVDPESRAITAIDESASVRISGDDIFSHPNAPWLRFVVSEAFLGIEYFD
jgi:Uma2 family endonuclease